MKVNYSWILPIKDEAVSLSRLITEIEKAMAGKAYEVSTDNSLSILKKIALRLPQLKIVNFKTYHGKWACLAAGFRTASGDTVITSDSDLQDDPKEVHKLLRKPNRGYNLVSGWRKSRHDSWYKIAISRLGNWLVTRAFNKHFRDINSPFKVIRRDVIGFLPFHGTLLRFSMLFAYRQGFRIAEVQIKHRPRLYGKSKFGTVKYLRILYDTIWFYFFSPARAD